MAGIEAAPTVARTAAGWLAHTGKNASHATFAAMHRQWAPQTLMTRQAKQLLGTHILAF
jgi:hypothetical protein